MVSKSQACARLARGFGLELVPGSSAWYCDHLGDGAPIRSALSAALLASMRHAAGSGLGSAAGSAHRQCSRGSFGAALFFLIAVVLPKTKRGLARRRCSDCTRDPSGRPHPIRSRVRPYPFELLHGSNSAEVSARTDHSAGTQQAACFPAALGRALRPGTPRPEGN